MIDLTSSSNTLTGQSLWIWEGGDYVTATQMDPDKGYWINNLSGADVTLILSRASQQSASLFRRLKFYARSLQGLVASVVLGSARAAEEQPPSPPPILETSAAPVSGTGCALSTAEPQARGHGVLVILVLVLSLIRIVLTKKRRGIPG